MTDLLQPMIFSPEQVPHLAGKRVRLCDGNTTRLIGEGIIGDCVAVFNEGNWNNSLVVAYLLPIDPNRCAIAAVLDPWPPEPNAPADTEPMVPLARLQAAEEKIAELEDEIDRLLSRIDAQEEVNP